MSSLTSWIRVADFRSAAIATNPLVLRGFLFVFTISLQMKQ